MTITGDVQTRSKALFDQEHLNRYKVTDRIMGLVLALEWVIAMVLELAYNPTTWSGSVASPSQHILNSVYLGGLITFLPVFLCIFHPGSTITRYSVAVAQMIWATIFIHITGGRIESHFHVFVSLAILANYRDWRVMVAATLVVLAHHGILGNVYPQSVFGVSDPGRWRWLEHGVWVAVEDAALIAFSATSLREMKAVANREAQLQITNETIEEQIVERTRMLDTAMREATSANIAKSQFLTNISHELRTPLYGIHGNLQLINRSTLDHQTMESIRKIDSSAIILGGIINNILDLSEIETGRLTIESLPMDFRETIAEICDAWRESATAKGLDLRLSIAEGSYLGFGDPTRIRQVAGNLVNNAVKFTTNGSVTVRVGWRDIASGQARLTIEIADTGSGIPSDKLQQIFSSFAQADGSSTRTFGGVGIGLAIASRLTNLMGGEIRVESEINVGSSFTISLPIACVVKKEKDEESAPTREGFGELHRKVLLVGNNPFGLRLFAQLLKQCKCETDSFSPTPEDWSGIDLASYNVLIVDLDNAEEAVRMKKFVGTDVACIALVTPETQVKEGELLATYADLTIVKPAGFRQIHRAIAQLPLIELDRAA